MNSRAILSFSLGIYLASLPVFSSSSSIDPRDYVYNVTTKLIDDVKESEFTIKLKCRSRTIDIIACRLSEPKYKSIYLKNSCNNSSLCGHEQNLTADSSYVGNFEIKYRNSMVERLTVSSGSSLKQLSFYRIMANHLFPGVDLKGKHEGTFPMVEESVYGKCQALVKIVGNTRRENSPDDNRPVRLVPLERNPSPEAKKVTHEMLSIKKTRDLESCYPVPGLLIFDTFFYHPMMASVHFDIKSSISRLIVSDSACTSYTTEDIAVKSLDRGVNVSMLHVRTTLTLDSRDISEELIPRIMDPVSVLLPFVDGFDPANRVNNSTIKTTPMPTSASTI